MSPLIITIRRLVVRPLVVNWNLIHGMLAYRMGRLTRARRRFRRVLDLDADHFRARVLLGRIHFHFLEVSEGLAHLSYARRLDPARFHRAGLDEYFQGYDLELGLLPEKQEAPLFANFRSDNDSTLFDPSGLDPSGLESSGLGLAETWEFDPLSGSSLPPDSLTGPSPRPLGDFSSAQEYGRFKDLPPITRDEIEEIDWNQVTSDLFE